MTKLLLQFLLKKYQKSKANIAERDKQTLPKGVFRTSVKRPLTLKESGKHTMLIAEYDRRGVILNEDDLDKAAGERNSTHNPNNLPRDVDKSVHHSSSHFVPKIGLFIHTGGRTSSDGSYPNCDTASDRNTTVPNLDAVLDHDAVDAVLDHDAVDAVLDHDAVPNYIVPYHDAVPTHDTVPQHNTVPDHNTVLDHDIVLDPDTVPDRDDTVRDIVPDRDTVPDDYLRFPPYISEIKRCK